MPAIHLASGSPRRRELLEQIGVPHQVLKVEVDEQWQRGESAEDYVVRLAMDKAAAGWAKVRADGLAPLPVLGADTTVVLGGEVLGKPRDRDDAIAMLGCLSDRAHEVLTAVCLCQGERLAWRLSRTEVRFKALSRDEIEAYWASGEPADKAGAYGIQGLGAVFVQHLSGSYTGVVGLPLFETAELLRVFGVSVWQGAAP